MFVIPPTKATEPDSRFEFELDGEKRSAPLLEFVDTDVAEAFLLAATVTTQRLAYIRALADGDADAETALRRLHADQLAALVDAYDEASGISAGESEASTGS